MSPLTSLQTKCILALLFYFVTFSLNAQYQGALRIENYAGTNSIFLNPASSNNYPLRWDLNLVSAGFFIDNSLAYISNTSLGDLSKNGDQVRAGWQMENIIGENLVADFYRDTIKNNYIQTSQTINGPAFLFNTNGGQSIGAFYNLRVMAGAPKLPGSLNYYSYISKSVNEFIDFPSFNFSFMAWDEIGAHFSQRISTSTGYISAGINLKVLRGYEAGYISVNNDTNIRFLDSNQVEVSGLNTQYGYTTSNIDIVENESFNRDPSGSGFGVDLGFNYVIEDETDTPKLRLGVSINDIGTVKFKTNAEVHALRGTQNIIFDEETYQSFTTLEEARDQASRDVLGAIGLSQIDEDLKVGLPTTFSLQADYKVIENVYVSGLFINRISFSPYSVKATNFLALAPRFEHRWGMVSLPINITEYKRVKMGAAVRLGFIVLGTDDLGSIIGTKEFRGTDLYVGVKANPFQIGKSKRGGSKGSGKKSQVKCYKF